MDALIPPRLPGLLVRRPLGQGVDPPWLAKADDGSWVVARRATRPPELPDHPALLGVFGSVTDEAGAAWVLTAYTSGHGLDRRLERIGRVGRALAVAWGAQVAEALAAIHDAGLVHGDLRASRVLLGTRDTVLLDASCARAGGDDAKADDVRALARLLEEAAGEPLGGVAGDAVAAATSGDLDAAGLARRLTGRRAGLPRDRRAPARRAWRGLVAAAAVVGLLAGAAVLGAHLADTSAQPAVLAVSDAIDTSPSADPVGLSPDPSLWALPEADPDPIPSSEPVVDETDWPTVLADLDLARGLVFETADVALLADVDAPGSQAQRRDRALVRWLRASQVTAEGWATNIVAVEPRSVSPDRAVLVVTDVRAAYVLRDASGAVVARQDASEPTTWVVRLTATQEGWRISSVMVSGASPR
jgi:Protein tyrosine and serine/threonine kinase